MLNTYYLLVQDYRVRNSDRDRLPAYIGIYGHIVIPDGVRRRDRSIIIFLTIQENKCMRSHDEF